MNDHGDQSSHQKDGITCRLRQSGDKVFVGLGGLVVVELADAHNSTLTSLSMSPETIGELLRPHLSIFAELQLDGSVAVDSEFFALFPQTKTTDIYELVKEALAPEMLRDEPNLKEQLNELRRKLTASLTLVDQTLANLDKDQS